MSAEGSGELSTVYEASRGAISGLAPKGPQELALEISRTMLPSGFLFLRGLPNLLHVNLSPDVSLEERAYLIEGE